MRILKMVVLWITLLSVGACTSLSKDDCAQMNWSQQGLEDGKRGLPANLIGDHAATCSKHGFTADQVAWTSNYKEGLKSFCTEAQGYQLGSLGGFNPQTCPTSLEADFLRGFRKGQAEYEAEESRRKEQEEIQRKESSKQDAIASARSRSECSFDSDCGSDRTCRRDSEFVDGELIDVGICQ